jgi:uncharacterized protein (TIGR02466 family)
MILHRNVEYLFPTPVGVAIIDPTKFDFKKYADLVFNSLTPENIEYMNANGVSPTVDDLHVKPEFRELVELVESEVHTFFVEELGLDPNDLSMECMWANVQVDGCRHHIHLHPNSFYSGSLYLDIPTEGFADPGAIFFVDPRHAKQMQHANYSKVHGLSMRSKGIKPETGMLLMFPSWLEHGTDVCKVGPGKYRISLSFNYALRRADGMTMKLNLK